MKHTYDYKSCKLYGREAFLGGNTIRLCCNGHLAKEPEFFKFYFNDLGNGINEFKERTNKLFKMHSKNLPGPCEGCPFLIDQIGQTDFLEEKLLKHISFTIGFNGDVCNIACIYCKNQHKKYTKSTNPSLLNLVKQVVESYGDTALPNLRFASGEFFFRKDAEEILEYLLPKKCKMSVVTNATIYSENFMEMIKTYRVHFINTSLDCGTKETHIKVKKRNLFDTVIKNLITYSNAGLEIRLKYIFLPGINDNEDDLINFLIFAKSISAKIEISTDIQNRKNNLPSHTMDAIFWLYQKSQENNLSVQFRQEGFSEYDRSKIKNMNMLIAQI